MRVRGNRDYLRYTGIGRRGMRWRSSGASALIPGETRQSARSGLAACEHRLLGGVHTVNRLSNPQRADPPVAGNRIPFESDPVAGRGEWTDVGKWGPPLCNVPSGGGQLGLNCESIHRFSDLAGAAEGRSKIRCRGVRRTISAAPVSI